MTMHQTPLVLGETLHKEVFAISQDDRRRHLYVLGATGTGKSTFLVNLIRQDMAEGHGLAFIDPHGQDAEKALSYVPAKRVKHVTYFNPADLDRPVGFNVLQDVAEDQRDTVADNVVLAFKHLWQHESWGPSLERLLLHSVRALLDTEGSDLLGIVRILTEERFRDSVVKQSRNPLTSHFWREEFPYWADRNLDQRIDPVLNKVERALAHPAVRNVLCQSPNLIDLRKTMDEGRILVANLSKGVLGEGNAAFLGSLLISAIAQAAISRSVIAESERRVFHLYVDEFQNFPTASISLILSEARKYGLTLCLSNQFLGQVPELLRKSVLANAASFVAFRVGAEDAPFIAKHLGWPNPDTLQGLPNFRAMGKFLISGSPSRPVTLRAHPLPSPDPDLSAEVIAFSRATRARARSSVEERIVRFLKSAQPARRKNTKRKW
ncbi:type IV secretory system conjugative DNA transfer family protein [Rhodoplanes sp. SY1]|uniref:type IV secretory system conjugative DNA transfer family protein n=1 Tax=Rhodoplanes sp. SY1 TaxID=3166646 RepID=UPI0038B47F26